MNSLFKLKFKMHKLVNIIFYLIIFVLGFFIGLTINSVSAEELETKNTHVVCRDSKNLFNINGNVITRGTDGAQKQYNTVENGILTTVVNTSNTHGVGQKFTNLNGKTFTVSAKVVSTGSGYSGYLTIYDGGKLVLGKNIALNQTGAITYTGTTDNIVIAFATAGGENAQFTDIQLELGDSLSFYEPYGEQICEIILTSDNMFYDISKNIIGELDSKDLWVYDIVTCFLSISGITILVIVVLSIFKFFVRG